MEKCYVYLIASSDARVLSQMMEEMRRDVFKNVERRPPKYRFDLWDFGGQQIYYTSHQTFLNERAIYVLTVDMSKPLDEVISTEIKVPKWKGNRFTKNCTRYLTLLLVTVFYPMALNRFHVPHCQKWFSGSSFIGCRGLLWTPLCVITDNRFQFYIQQISLTTG